MKTLLPEKNKNLNLQCGERHQTLRFCGDPEHIACIEDAWTLLFGPVLASRDVNSNSCKVEIFFENKVISLLINSQEETVTFLKFCMAKH